jgi:hypothetical protein
MNHPAPMTSQFNFPSRPDPAISKHQLNKTWWNEVTPVHAAQVPLLFALEAGQS